MKTSSWLMMARHLLAYKMLCKVFPVSFKHLLFPIVEQPYPIQAITCSYGDCDFPIHHNVVSVLLLWLLLWFTSDMSVSYNDCYCWKLKRNSCVNMMAISSHFEKYNCFIWKSWLRLFQLLSIVMKHLTSFGVYAKDHKDLQRWIVLN
jgi:hypothetical protein